MEENETNADRVAAWLKRWTPAVKRSAKIGHIVVPLVAEVVDVWSSARRDDPPR